MSDVVERRKIRGNQWNWDREVDVEVYSNGIVRLQQAGNPVDVVLLTPRQIREIAKRSAEAQAK